MCGGRASEACEKKTAAGSSPRVRGTRPTRRADDWPLRIIPACAGDAWCRSRASSRASDHPRVCGGRAISWHRLFQFSGSSPRVRGTRSNTARRRLASRIIPACAGDALSRETAKLSASDHPRVCGGRERVPAPLDTVTGSSPRVRGTLFVDPRRRCLDRIIPACAGDAGLRALVQASFADHPRVCGGRLAENGTSNPHAGSSPRVRGTHVKWQLGRRRERIIPACAGDAGNLAGGMMLHPHHPRVCGGR